MRLNSQGALVSATTTGTAGILVFSILPVLIGRLAEHFRLNDSETGLLSSAYFSVYALVALAAPVWVRRYRWRTLAAVAFMLQFSGYFCLYHSTSVSVAAMAMAVAGAGAALLLPISMTLIADRQDSERAYGISVAFQQLIPTLLLFVLGLGWLGAPTLTSLLWCVGVISVVCLLLSWPLPAAGRPFSTAAALTTGKNWRGATSVIAVGLNFAGFAAIWSFLERIATQAGLTVSYSTTWIAVGLFMTAVGPLLAAWLSGKLQRVQLLLPASLIAIAALQGLSGKLTATDFALVLIVFPLLYYVAFTFLLGIVADADHSGRAASLITFALALGAVAGPSLFGVLRGAQAFSELHFISLLLLLSTLLGIAADPRPKQTTGTS